MKVSVDTNVLVRVVLQDDEKQARLAGRLLKAASLIAIPIPCLCELVWILHKGARLSKDEVCTALRTLLDAGNVVVNRPAVEAGLALLDAGGDFADGVMAFEGRWLGGETFVSFDQRAVRLLAQQGSESRLLS